MFSYRKWLGASLGWVITGNPLGGALGFMAVHLLDKKRSDVKSEVLQGLTELELHVIVLASHLLKIHEPVPDVSIQFLLRFLDEHFDAQHSAKRKIVINHCLQKLYDLQSTCDWLRLNTSMLTREQIVHLMFDVAQSDGELTAQEQYFIFRIAGYININDVKFRQIKAQHPYIEKDCYAILGVKPSADITEIRRAYRRLTLQYHPDRHKLAGEMERRELSQKFQEIQAAYNEAKRRLGM